MKKLNLFLIIASFLLVFSGCQKSLAPQDVPETPDQTQTETPQEPEGEDEIVLIRASELPSDVLSWNEVNRYTGDIDGDGSKEDVILVTSAECDDEGEFVWNDGQSWALYVQDAEKAYLLMKEYINTGNPYFEVADYYMTDAATPRITIITSTGAGFSLKSYTFSDAEQAYVEYVMYDTKNETDGGINRRFSSLPEYRTGE